MLPHLFPPRRFASQFQGAPTAVAAPFSVLQADWSTPDVSGAVPPGQYFFGVSRSPLTASFRYMPNAAHNAGSYQAVFGQADDHPPLATFTLSTLSAGDVPLTWNLTPGYLRELDPLWWDDTDPDLADAYHPHGPTLYTVRTPDGKTATYLDGTGDHPTQVTLYYTDSGLTPDTVPSTGDWESRPKVFFFAYRLAGNGWVAAGESVATASDFGESVPHELTVQVTAPGYYYFTVATPPTTVKDVDGAIRARQACVVDYNARIEFTVTASIIGFAPIAHLPSLDQDVMGLRVNAVSGMMTPHPAMLYEGGQVAGVQLPSCCSWDQPLENDDPFSFITALQTSTTLPLKRGIYAFHKPTDVDNFELQSPFIFHRSVITGTNNPLVPCGGWIVYAATVPLTDGGYPSGACHLTITHAVEFQTTNTWFNVVPPSLTPKDYEVALEILRTTAQWHENPLHMKDILSTIASKGKALLRVAPSVAKVIGALFPGVSIPAAVANAAMALGNAL